MLASADQAEIIAEEWFKRRYSRRLGKTSFKQVMLDGGVWTIKADIEIKGELFDKVKKKIELRIDSESMNVVGYSDISEDSSKQKP